MLSIKQKRLLAILFLIILLAIDFFIVGRLDPVCRQAQGYGFGYPASFRLEEISQKKFGFSRIVYNFQNFFIFWLGPGFGKTYHNLKEFLLLDYSVLIFNILHFFAFLIFAFILLYFFRFNVFLVLIISLFFNLFHEYIAEGICMDPSFNDLWVNLIGSLVGSLIGVILVKK
jgi:VanZ family protein